jgi:flagellum-specific peptidoglycan hydrolase FlgJ
MPAGSNNPFGIKATGNQPYVDATTTEYVGGLPVRTTARFAKFSSLTEAFDAHARLLATSPLYAGARQHEADPIAFANALTGIYATDPMYGAKLSSLISGIRTPGLSSSQSWNNSHREVHIGEVNIHTQATDAKGIMQDMGRGIAAHDLVVASDSGPH